ncbi:MAG TPA: nucleoside 2-deoxyribosyltransferase [Candidatus Saccharimonadales bacterium]
MKHLFLSTSFSGQVDAQTGQVLPEFRKSIQAILKSLREQPDVEVFCAMEHEGWKTSDELADKGVRHDIEQVDAADVLVALMHDGISAGLQFELGYAIAKGKRVILAMRHDWKLPYFNQGLVSGGYVTLVTYDTPANLATQLPIAVNAPRAEAA